MALMHPECREKGCTAAVSCDDHCVRLAPEKGPTAVASEAVPDVELAGVAELDIADVATAVASPGGDLEAGDVLFIGLGTTGLCWYRCALPAHYLQHDWVGLVGAPPRVLYQTGMVRGGTNLPAVDSYKIVVVQQARGEDWLRFIRKLQRRGVKVIYEVDDYLHGILRVADHEYREGFTRKELRRLEMCMVACDGMIVATDFLADKYRRRFNDHVWVCRNGIDVGRYALTRPDREEVNVGWAGATGHAKAVGGWLGEIAQVMAHNAKVNFVSIGMPFADAIAKYFAPHRCMSVPFTALENYPAAMTSMDVAIAPAASGAFFRGKSDLRWVEASALGIPVIGDPDVYPDIEHGVTGFHAATADEMGDVLRELAADRGLRLQVGATAREHVRASRDMAVMAEQWTTAFRELLALDAPSGSAQAPRRSRSRRRSG